MIKLAASFLTLVFVTISFVPAASAQPANLHDLMKDINTEVKAVAQQADNRDRNADSMTRALKIRKLFVFAFNFVPDKILKAPELERPALMRTYDKFLGRIIGAFSDLEDNFEKNDNAKAKTTLSEIQTIKREAHNIFTREL